MLNIRVTSDTCKQGKRGGSGGAEEKLELGVSKEKKARRKTPAHARLRATTIKSTSREKEGGDGEEVKDSKKGEGRKPVQTTTKISWGGETVKRKKGRKKKNREGLK